MRSTALAMVAVGAVALAAAGCSSQSGGASDHATASVVASTDVWGSVAAAVAGDHAEVTSIVTGANVDPHSFEVTPSDAAKLTDATLVVYNGGGYDHWVDDVLADHRDVPAVDAYSLLQAGAAPANEHVFYDLTVAKAVATDVADKLAGTDAAHAADYRRNAEEFNRRADGIVQVERAIAQSHPGAAVVSTEPVAFYLLRAAGVTDRTPGAFANAVEEGDDPAPADVAAVLDLITNRQVSALVSNPQTETPATKQIEAAAQQAGLPIVTVTETLPAGTDYLTWQRQTAEQLAGRLGQPAPASR
jgi:zinc/manganese transport system substrate-binding protein